MSEVSVRIKPSQDFKLLSDVALIAATSSRDLPEELLEILLDFAEGRRDFVGNLDGGAAAAVDGEFLFGPELTVADRVLLTAFRASDGGHGDPLSVVDSQSQSEAESGEAHKVSPDEAGGAS